MIRTMTFALSLFLLSAHGLVASSTQTRSLNTKEEYLEILKLAGQKKHGEAIIGLKSLIAKEHTCDRAYAKIVAVSKEINQLDNALEFFQRLARTNPANPYASYGLGLVYKEKKDYQEAAKYLKQSIALKPKSAEVFISLVDAYNELKKLDEAEKYLSTVIKENPKYASAACGMAHAQQLAMAWEKGLRSFEHALSIDPNLLEAYNGKGTIYFLTGRNKEALAVLEREERLIHNGILSDPEAEAKLKKSLGQVYDKMGNYSQALQLYEQALQLYKTIGDRDGENEATNWIGKVYSRLGDYQKTLEYCQRGLAISQASGNRKEQAEALKGIAAAYYSLGKYQSAIEQHQLALNLYQAMGDRRGEAIALGNIATAYSEIGDYQRALDHAQTTAKILAEIKDRGNHLIAIGNMGTIYEDLGDYPNALKCYGESLEIATSVGDRNGQGILFRLLGNLYGKSGDYQRALEYFKNGLRILQQVGAKHQQAVVLNKIGLVYLSLGENTKAVESLAKALTLAKSSGLAAAIWQSHAGLAEAFQKEEKFHLALSHYRSAIEIIEDVRNRLSLAQQKSGFLQDKIDVYQKLCELLLTLHQKFPQKDHYTSAFYFSEKSKAQALLSLLPQANSINQLKTVSEEFQQNMARIDQALKDQHTKMLQKREELASKEGKSKELIHTIQGHIEELQTKIDKLEQEKINSFNQMKQRFPDYAKLYDPEVLHVENVQKDILKDGEVLIEYLVGEKNTLVFIINKHGIAYERISVGRNRLKEMIKSLGGVFSLVDSTEGKEKRSLKELSNIQLEKAHELYDAVFKPIEKHIRKGSGIGGQGSDELVIVPDDVLNYVPFEMLVTRFEGYKAHYLIENYSMSYAYSASLLNPKLKKKTQAPELDLLAMGNPDFGAMMLRLGFPEINFTKEEVDQLVHRRAGTAVPVNGFSQLPYADFEVNAISQLVRKKKVFRNEQATERCFKDFAGKARVIHLATHSIVERANPLYSRIVFATNPSINQKGEDSNLYAYEIFDLNLAADLVVLSGCETGLGRLRRGEGLEGISRAFLYAGAPALVASLWKVADKEPTPLLMIKFYKNLAAGMDKRAALQKAKRELIAEGKYDNPFYWAPFILIGDVSPVPLSRPLPSWPTLMIGFGILIAVVQTYFLGISLKRRKASAKVRTS